MTLHQFEDSIFDLQGVNVLPYLEKDEAQNVHESCHTGGLLLGGGGLGIPTLKCSPVALRFQRTLCIRGQLSLLAPLVCSGHSIRQQPQYQHSSGYMMMGGLFFSGLGM
jgi:hypothetical protein